MIIRYSKVIYFICSFIFFVKWSNFNFIEVCYETALSYMVINALDINSEKKSQNSFISFAGIPVDLLSRWL